MKFAVPFALISLGFARLALAADAPAGVVQFDHRQLDDAFAGGGRGLLGTANYKISAGRRVAPGTVEVHTSDTDIFYVLEGSATFVTGGTVVEPATIGPGEIRGKSVAGGVPRHLTKGDVIVIPKGTPHQFTQVDGNFLYFVVKVTE